MNRRSTYCCLFVVLLLAIVVSSAYRGIFSDDTNMYINHAGQIYDAHRLQSGESRSVASILYASLIALSYTLVGKTLLATHLFPFLLAVSTPPLFFLALQRLTGEWLWALAGTILYMFYPTNLVWLNQNLTEPIFVFVTVLAMLLISLSKGRSRFLVVVGLVVALLPFARLFDGLLFVLCAGVAIIYQERKQFPVKWLVITLLAGVGLHVLVLAVLHSSPLEYYRYIRQMSAYDTGAVNYTGDLTNIARTVAAVKIFLQWFLGGKLALLVVPLSGVGMYQAMRREQLFPALCLVGYSGFLLFVLGQRQVDILFTRLATKILPALVLLLVVGAKTTTDWFCGHWISKQRLASVLAAVTFLLFFSGFGVWAMKRNTSFLFMMSDIIPSAPLRHILRSHPVNVLDTNREEIYRQVLGEYRPSYRSKVAQEAFETQLPQQAQAQADFAYRANFLDGEQWKLHVWQLTGTSSLWTPEYPGHIGAFPYGAGGMLIYKFLFERKIQTVTLSDVHTQWEAGDVVRMWTSPDGEHWTLRYDDPLRYQETYYHHVFEHEFTDAQAMYVKYEFYAGDASRTGNDNRGAALQALFLAVNFQEK